MKICDCCGSYKLGRFQSIDNCPWAQYNSDPHFCSDDCKARLELRRAKQGVVEACKALLKIHAYEIDEHNLEGIIDSFIKETG